MPPFFGVLLFRFPLFLPPLMVSPFLFSTVSCLSWLFPLAPPKYVFQNSFMAIHLSHSCTANASLLPLSEQYPRPIKRPSRVPPNLASRSWTSPFSGKIWTPPYPLSRFLLNTWFQKYLCFTSNLYPPATPHAPRMLITKVLLHRIHIFLLNYFYWLHPHHITPILL